MCKPSPAAWRTAAQSRPHYAKAQIVSTLGQQEIEVADSVVGGLIFETTRSCIRCHLGRNS